MLHLLVVYLRCVYDVCVESIVYLIYLSLCCVMCTYASVQCILGVGWTLVFGTLVMYMVCMWCVWCVCGISVFSALYTCDVRCVCSFCVVYALWAGYMWSLLG